ncbi:Uncharacterised protein [Mycobacteroides abscessus subsp. abscessus]|nr:Uncharacterised protein [Mycobacteroides abscessus subsp. abscessus]SKU72242.1 Uncharacterised protein [Mycobacteroides abscessus subsp. abscessus]
MDNRATGIGCTGHFGDPGPQHPRRPELGDGQELIICCGDTEADLLQRFRNGQARPLQ